MTDIYKRAARKGLRFPSLTGDLTVEQLWDLPLTGKADKNDLDKLARGVSSELRSIEQDSFVDEKPNPGKADLELKLEVLKDIIATKKADKAASEKAAETAEYKRKLLAVKASKEEAKLAGMSEAEVDAELAKLG